MNICITVLYMLVAFSAAIPSRELRAMQPDRDMQKMSARKQNQLNQKFIRAVLEKKSLKKIGNLLEKGANSNSRNYKTDRPALSYATMHNNMPLAVLLFDYEASSNPTGSKNFSPLHCAAMHGRENFVKLFLAFDADPNSVTKKGKTPLHYAVPKNFVAIVVELLMHGAEPTIEDEDGNSPLTLALDLGKTDIAELLMLAQTFHSCKGSKVSLFLDKSIPESVKSFYLNIAISTGRIELLKEVYEVLIKNLKKPSSYFPQQLGLSGPSIISSPKLLTYYIHHDLVSSSAVKEHYGTLKRTDDAVVVQSKMPRTCGRTIDLMRN